MAVANPGHGIRPYSTLLSEKEKTYTTHLTDVRGLTITQAYNRVLSHIQAIIRQLEKATHKHITQFMIGKSHVYSRKGQTFDAMEHSTWRVSGGINQRWSSKYAKMNYNGLVVLFAMPDVDVPASQQGSRKRNVRENRRETTVARATKDDGGEVYAYQLENMLIDHFKDDERCQNVTCRKGPSSKGGVAGVVYFAYKLSGSLVSQKPEE